MKTAICTANNGVYEILSVLSTPDPSAMALQPDGSKSPLAQGIEDTIHQNVESNIGVTVAGGVRDDTHYIEADQKTATQRPASQVTASATTVPADGSSTITLSGMANNTTVTIDGPDTAIFTTSTDNASENLTFAIPGTYAVTAQAPFPAKPKTFDLTTT